MTAKSLSNLIILLFTAAFAPAATRLVPDQYPNIQAAINDAHYGDTVIVAPGTYTGVGNYDIDFKGKAIIVRSIDPNDPAVVASTIVDCQSAGRGFHFRNGEEGDSVLAGLTITKGLVDGGGGIFCSSSSPTIRDCTISQCTASWGGGVCSDYGSPAVIHCVLTGNHAIYEGGALSFYGGSPLISNCVITGNSAATGGGIKAARSALTIANCMITDNCADGSISGLGSGGGIFLHEGNAIITNCTIANNSAIHTGGGITCWKNKPTITSSIIWGNTATSSTNVYGHPLVSYSNVQGGFSGTGNIDADPLFVDLGSGNFHLSAASPCIDAGNPGYSPPPGQTDIDGDPRLLGFRVDMGADEALLDVLAIGISSNLVRFNILEGQTNIPEKTIQIWNAGIGTLNWQLAEDCSWLQVNPKAGTSTGQPTDVALTPDIAGLATGQYNCQLTVSDPCAINSPRTVHVQLLLIGPMIKLSTVHVEFSAYEGDAVLPQQTFTVRNDGGGLLSWQAGADCDWLDVSPTAGTSRGDANQITLTADVSDLPWGHYDCQLTVSDPCAINSPRMVHVLLDVIGPEIKLSTAHVEFSAYQDDAVLPQQTFTIRNDGGGLLSWQVGADCDWLDVSPTAGTSRGEPNEITLTADVSALPWGHYDCNVTISDPNAANSPVTLPVSLELAGPILSVSSNRFDFQAEKENPTPSDQTLSIQNTAGGTLNWQITAPNDCNWLSVYPLTGRSTGQVNEVTLSVDAGGLEYGSYSCQLLISDPNAQHGLETIQVNLTVRAPVIAVEPTSFQFRALQTDPRLFEQTLSIHNDGNDTLKWEISLTDDCEWLTVYPLVGWSRGDVNEVTLTVDTTALAGGFYSCDLTISDPNASNSPQTIEVRLHVGLEQGWLYVPDEFPNIQTAIDWALPADVVVIAPGTYTGPGNRDIDFLGKPITVRSIDPNDPQVVASTVIDCNAGPGDHHRGFNFRTGEDASSILAGFTIKNGYAESGAAILCTGFGQVATGPRIRNCIITQNTAGTVGGGIYIEDISPTITNCTIAGNKCIWGTRDRAHGGAIFCRESDAVIANSTITENLAVSSGGALYCGYSGNPTITNCVLYSNSAPRGPEIALDPYRRDPSRLTLIVSYSNVHGGLSAIHNEGDGTLDWRPGNINADPYFVEPGYWDTNDTPSDSRDDFWVDGDYHLMSEGWRWYTQRKMWIWDSGTSRCIDAGDPNSPLGDESLSVPADPNNDWGVNVRINMGAYGGTAEASIPPHGWTIRTDYNNDGIVNFTDFACWSKNDAHTPTEPHGHMNPDPIDLALLADRWLEQTTWFGTLPPPTAASNPDPFDGATGVRTTPVLSWQPGFGAVSHDVYFGTTKPPAFQRNQSETTFNPGTLNEYTTYYWRIDEVNTHTTTPGTLWSFGTTSSGGR